MFEAHYGLHEDPFRLTPDPAFRYQHRSYQKAEAYMQYALRRREGLIMVTGAPGLGKTTLVTGTLTDLDPARTVVRNLVTTQFAATDFLHMVAHAFGVGAVAATKSEVLRRIEGFLDGQAQAARHCILLVDEAQALGHGALEELRLLTNLQRAGHPLLQVLLLGHEELREIVKDPALEQLRQRMIAACHLEPLDDEETAGYIRHRLLVAGWSGVPRIAGEGVRLVHQASGGVPRRVNHLMSRLLLHGSLEGRDQLGERDVSAVVDELAGEGLLVTGLDEGRPTEPTSGATRVEALAVEMDAAERHETAVARAPADPPAVTAERAALDETAAAPAESNTPSAEVPAPAAAPGNAAAPAVAVRDEPPVEREARGPPAPATTVSTPSPARDAVETPPTTIPTAAPAAPLREARPPWRRAVTLLAIGAGAAAFGPAGHWRATGVLTPHEPARTAEHRPARPAPEPPAAQLPEPAPPITSAADHVRDDDAPAGGPAQPPGPRPAATAGRNPIPLTPRDEPVGAGVPVTRGNAPASEATTPFALERHGLPPVAPATGPERRLDRLEQALADESLSPDRVTAEAVRVRLSGAVSFAYGSADLTTHLADALARLSELLLEDGLTRVRIVGHSDNVGAESLNLEMSRKRAAAVAGALTGHGVGPDRVSIEAKGSSEPLLSNLTPAGRRQNRRVELYLTVAEPVPVQISTRSPHEE